MRNIWVLFTTVRQNLVLKIFIYGVPYNWLDNNTSHKPHTMVFIGS